MNSNKRKNNRQVYVDPISTELYQDVEVSNGVIVTTLQGTNMYIEDVNMWMINHKMVKSITTETIIMNWITAIIEFIRW